MNEIDVFWNTVAQIQDYRGNFVFKNLSQFLLLTLLIPYSNASAERLWSKQNLEKTKLRNRLNFNTLRGLLLASEYIKQRGGLKKFEISEKMLQKAMKVTTYVSNAEPVSPSIGVEGVYNGLHIHDDVLQRVGDEEKQFKRKTSRKRRSRRQDPRGNENDNPFFNHGKYSLQVLKT